MWGDVDLMMPAFQRNGYQSVTVKLVDPSAFDSFQAAVATDPRLDLKPERERDYYDGQSATTGTLIRVFATFVTAILSIGAVFGAMNTMYAAVAYRTREIGTLRALGFSRVRIVTAFLAESVALAIVGGVDRLHHRAAGPWAVDRRDEHDQLQRAGVQVPHHPGAARWAA